MSFPSSLVGFEGSIPTCTCFIQKMFCDLILLLFSIVVLEWYVRGKRGGRGGQGEDAWS